MSAMEWLVALLGLAAVAWVNWYFFVAGRSGVAATVADGGVAEVVVLVNGGYDPSTIKVKSGRRLRLTFDRQETNSCSEELVLPDFGIRTFLPAFKRTTVEITPPNPGRYAISCGMSMLHGTIVAE